jgi:hypothetical protein
MLRKDKALLENLTRKYGKDVVINEMRRGRQSKFTPSELYDMYEIPKGYFKNRNDLTKIIIPNNIKKIGDDAFRGCKNLTSVTIPDSVTSIGDNAFSGCDGLTSVTIPDSVTTIGVCAFWACERLASVTIGNGVTDIGSWAFRYCDNLTTITIGNSVTNIGQLAFPDGAKIIRKKVVKSNGDYDNWFNKLSYYDLIEISDMWSLDFFDISYDNMSEKEFITAMKRWWNDLDRGEKYEIKDAFINNKW